MKIDNLRQLIDDILPSRPDAAAFLIRKEEGVRQITNREFCEDVRSLAAVLRSQGTSHVALIGENSYKWTVCYLAAIYSARVVVPIDKDLSKAEITTILGISEAGTILWGDTHDEIILPLLEQHPQMHSICFHSDNYSRKLSSDSMEAAIIEGRLLLEQDNRVFDAITVRPDDCYSIVFTSGTTGTSKGVMLSHRNVISDLDSSRNRLHIGAVQMAILPMHHTFQSNLGILNCLYFGTTMAINNSIRFFSQNLGLFAPTDLLCVPLVAETLHANIWKNIESSGKASAVRNMIRLSNFLLRCGIDLRRKFFKKIIAAMGGKLKDIFCGGALLDADVARGLFELGFDIYIGYGITECSPLVAGNISQIPAKMGSCGQAFDCNEIKLVDTDENGDGEIWIKGSNVMLGYYKNPEATAEAIEEGWYKSGDIGRWDADGFLYITGRKKNLIVLNNGKNVYPEELEGLLLKSPWIKEVVVSALRSQKGEETTIAAEVFADEDMINAQGVSKEVAIEHIARFVEEQNLTLPYYKRIVSVTYRETEFEKTTTKKIKRSQS